MYNACKSKKNVNQKFKMNVLRFTFIISLIFISLYFYIPKDIKVLEGSKKDITIGFPFVLKDDNRVLNTSSVCLNAIGKYNYEIEGVTKGSSNLKALIGFIPIKKVTVDVIPSTKLVPLGSVCGIRIFEEGVLVLKEGNVITPFGIKQSPSKGKIEEGDLIKKVNDVVINNKEELTREINKGNGKEISLTIVRDKITKKVSVTPIKENITGVYKIGLWVRDSSQGIGTMTYYNPKTGVIGSLGHAIVDVDTGKSFNVRKGSLLKSDITYIKKGTSGSPGEIMGIIYDGDKYKYGNIIKNSNCGIITIADDKIREKLKDKIAYEISLSSEVKLGKAYIMSNVIDNKVKLYEVEIEEINKYDYGNSKGMIIKIVDEELISKTGGIVQGMSGSPILQDNKIIGAVTHVFVNDPKKGFGIFIESMLEEED